MRGFGRGLRSVGAVVEGADSVGNGAALTQSEVEVRFSRGLRAWCRGRCFGELRLWGTVLSLYRWRLRRVSAEGCEPGAEAEAEVVAVVERREA